MMHFFLSIFRSYFLHFFGDKGSLAGDAEDGPPPGARDDFDDAASVSTVGGGQGQIHEFSQET